MGWRGAALGTHLFQGLWGKSQLTTQGPLTQDCIRFVTIDFCPSQGWGDWGRGAEASLPVQEPLKPNSRHTTIPQALQTSELPLPAAGSLSSPLYTFAHSLSAGSEFTLFKSLAQTAFLQYPRSHTPHPSSNLGPSLRHTWFSIYTWFVYYNECSTPPLSMSLPLSLWGIVGVGPWFLFGLCPSIVPSEGCAYHRRPCLAGAHHICGKALSQGGLPSLYHPQASSPKATAGTCHYIWVPSQLELSTHPCQ